jgi:hypothetical protein
MEVFESSAKIQKNIKQGIWNQGDLRKEMAKINPVYLHPERLLVNYDGSENME